jgi:hypothetical protein
VVSRVEDMEADAKLLHARPSHQESSQGAIGTMVWGAVVVQSSYARMPHAVIAADG